MEVMTPKHPQWNDFLERMQKACEVYDAEGQVGWVCDGTTKNARWVLERMADIDVEKSLTYFQQHGGFCDCEIGYNVYDDE